MCIPGLHLSLGIFNHLYTLLEESCEELDLQLAFKTPSTGAGGGESFEKYSAGLSKLHELEEQLEVLQQRQQTFQELLNHLLLTVDDFGDNPVVTSVHQNAATVDEEIHELVNNNERCAMMHVCLYV